MVKFFYLISFAASILVACWGSNWCAIAGSDNKCSPAGVKQMFCLTKLMAWLVVSFCSPGCSLSCLGSQQQFGWAESPLHQLNTWTFCSCTIIRFQYGFSRVCLQFARPAWLSHKPVSNRPPQLSREHHLGILKVQWIIQTAKINPLRKHQFQPFTWAALASMAADIDAKYTHRTK